MLKISNKLQGLLKEEQPGEEDEGGYEAQRRIVLPDDVLTQFKTVGDVLSPEEVWNLMR